MSGPNDVVLRPLQSNPNNVMLGPPTSTVTTPSAVTTTTLAALQSGSARTKYVVAIEGYKYLLTDADPTAAVTAHSGRDWTQALPNLFVELNNAQALDPWNPFNKGGGKCVLKVQPDDADTLGIDINRTAYGAEAKLVYPMDRGGSFVWRKVGTAGYTSQPYVFVDNGINFTANTDVHVGTECIQIGAVSADKFEIVQRGKYSPFGTVGAGVDRFAHHHRIVADTNGVMLNPVVSQYPRTWKGRLVAVWMHVEAGGVLNSRANAQLVFAGRIAATYDDPNGFSTIELEPLLETIGDVTIGRDMYAGTATDGIYIAAGRTFNFNDNNSTASKNANALTVVSSGASGANQINADYYSLEEICSFLNNWLASELAAGRILGTYTWRSPVSSGANALRTKVYWQVNSGANTVAIWYIVMPGEVAAFLGVGGAGDSQLSGTGSYVSFGDAGVANLATTKEGDSTPWRMIAFRQQGAGGYSFQINLANQRGTLFDQYALMPACDKPTDSQGLSWGYFLLDNQYLFFGSFVQTPTVTTISNCSMAQYGLLNAKGDRGLASWGRKADDQTSGPVTVKQIFILSGPESTIVKSMFYSTGSQYYNSSFLKPFQGLTTYTWDSLGYGLGLDIPGELLGSAFELTVNNLPGAQAETVMIVDEPTKFADLIGVDFCVRWCFPRFKNGHFEIGRWQTPNYDLATVSLDETNKAEPVGHVADHRPQTALTDAWQANQVKIDYNRDVTLGSGGKYQNSITLEDSTAVDDNGGVAKAKTLSARNTYHDYLKTGQGLEQLMPRFYDLWSIFSRPIRITTRSVDLRYWEGLAPGDSVLFTDKFTRDPATGIRGTAQRAAIVTRLAYSPGGPTAGSLPISVAEPHGEADLVFLDLHRYAQYAPSALVDATQTNGGWDSINQVLYTTANEYSSASDFRDSSRFSAGDRIAIAQVDPDSPSSALSWEANVTQVDSDGKIHIDTGIVGWDSTKTYAITYAGYSNCRTLQDGKTFQASIATGMIGNVAMPFQYSTTTEPATTAANPTSYAEFLPSTALGDGRPLDAGGDTALARLANAYNDYGSGHQLLTLGGFNTIYAVAIGDSRSMVYLQPIYLGVDALSNAVYRYLYVEPWIGADSSPQTIWVTLTRSKPTWVSAPNNHFPTIQFNDVFQTFSATSSVATQVSAGVFGFSCVLKGSDGVAWLVVEATPNATFRGFIRMFEGPRITQ